MQFSKIFLCKSIKRVLPIASRRRTCIDFMYTTIQIIANFCAYRELSVQLQLKRHNFFRIELYFCENVNVGYIPKW